MSNPARPSRRPGTRRNAPVRCRANTASQRRHARDSKAAASPPARPSILAKNATASGWRSSESCLLIVMMPSSARARMRGARRSRVFGNRPRDKSMLNPDAPNCNPRNAEIGRGAKAQKQTSPKNVRCTQNGVGVCDDRNALRIRRVVQGCKCYWRAWHRSNVHPARGERLCPLG